MKKIDRNITKPKRGYYIPNRLKCIKKSKKWKAAALAGAIRPTSKPDIDNVIKSSFDGLNMVVWVDDSQVVELKTAKWYSDAPRLEMWVREVQPTEGIFS